MESRLKVIIADDNKDFSVPCSNLLKTYGFETCVLEKDGAALLEKIEEIKPDVVLCDIFMPYFDAICHETGQSQRSGKAPVYGDVNF